MLSVWTSLRFCCSGNGLNAYLIMNFRLVQFQIVFRRQLCLNLVNGEMVGNYISFSPFCTLCIFTSLCRIYSSYAKMS